MSRSRTSEPAAEAGRMTRGEAERLLALGREAQLAGPEARAWAERLTPERDALRAAVEWFSTHDEPGAAVELAAAIWRLWLLRGEIAEGRELLASVLDREGAAATSARARALAAAGQLAFRAGDQAESTTRNEEALRLARELGDRSSEALALVGLSRVAFRAGEYDRVCALAREALDLAHGLDASAKVAPLHMLAAGTRLSHDYGRADDLYRESLALNRDLRDSRMVSVELHNLGHVSLHRGDFEASGRYFAECTELRRESKDPYDRAMEQLNAAATAYHHNEHARAAELLTQAESTLDHAGIVLDPDDRYEVGWLRQHVSGETSSSSH